MRTGTTTTTARHVSRPGPVADPGPLWGGHGEYVYDRHTRPPFGGGRVRPHRPTPESDPVYEVYDRIIDNAGSLWDRVFSPGGQRRQKVLAAVRREPARAAVQGGRQRLGGQRHDRELDPDWARGWRQPDTVGVPGWKPRRGGVGGNGDDTRPRTLNEERELAKKCVGDSVDARVALLLFSQHRWVWVSGDVDAFGRDEVDELLRSGGRGVRKALLGALVIADEHAVLATRLYSLDALLDLTIDDVPVELFHGHVASAVRRHLDEEGVGLLAATVDHLDESSTMRYAMTLASSLR